MESALGSFFAGGLSQSLVNEYRAPVHLLARRFFFQLLRSHRFQKAFSLAVELSSRDLFMVREREGRREGEREGERERERGRERRREGDGVLILLLQELHYTAQLHNEASLAELSLKKAEILTTRGDQCIYM